MALSTDTVEFREHFLGGDPPGTGTATVGLNGWSWEVNNADAEQRQVVGEPNHPGIARLRTRGFGFGQPAFGRLSLGNDDSAPVHTDNLERFRSILRVREPDGDGDFTDEGVFTGFGLRPTFYTNGSDLGGNCIFFSFRPSASMKWQAGCQTIDFDTFITSTTLVTSSGPDIALDTWYVLEAVQQTPGNWAFFVDGALIGNVFTNVPSMALTPQYRIVTQGIHETGYMIQADCDEFAYRLTMSGIPGITGW